MLAYNFNIPCTYPIVGVSVSSCYVMLPYYQIIHQVILPHHQISVPYSPGLFLPYVTLCELWLDSAALLHMSYFGTLAGGASLVWYIPLSWKRERARKLMANMQWLLKLPLSYGVQHISSHIIGQNKSYGQAHCQ